MEFKGTKGKWRVVPENVANIETENGAILAITIGKNSIADARLIAAAPELLEALQGLLEFCKSHQMDNYHTEQAQSAINKALK